MWRRFILGNGLRHNEAVRYPLKGLRQDRWKPAATLHGPETCRRCSPDAERLRKNPPCGDRVLYRKVDSNATHG